MALYCNAARKCPCAMARKALVRPQPGHEYPVTRLNGQRYELAIRGKSALDAKMAETANTPAINQSSSPQYNSQYLKPEYSIFFHEKLISAIAKIFPFLLYMINIPRESFKCKALSLNLPGKILYGHLK